MRPRFLIGVVVFALAVLALLFWLRPAKPPIAFTPAPTQGAPSPVPQTNRQPTNHPATVAQPSASPAATAVNPATASNNTVEARELRMKQAVEGQNVPVQFYGMVIDQDSNALSGVRVKLGVRHNETSAKHI